MKTTIIEILAEGMVQHRVDALLIGGYALPAYGVVRQTLDVDFLMDESARDSLGNILTNAGYVEQASTDNFVRYTHRTSHLMDVDVVFVDKNTFEKMSKESKPYAFGTAEIRVPSLAHLIALKLHAIKNDPERERRDMNDMIELLKCNKGKISAESLQSMCDRRRLEEIFYKLKRYV